jgi:ornithine cyclodeaminase
MLIISASDVERVFTMRDAIEADKRAFALQASGKCVVPLRINLDVEKGAGQALFMAAHLRGLDSTGVKIVSVFPGNAAKGKPVVPATMVLLDDETGEVSAIIEGTILTRLRTGALSGAASDLLARADAKVGALFGTGGQAASQFLAMLTVRRLELVRVFDALPGRAAAFVAAQGPRAASMGCKLVEAASSDEAIEGADIITTVTTSSSPVFDGDRVAPGTHVNGIGSYTPDKRELDEKLLLRADKVFVDNREAVLAEAGDFAIPMGKGVFGLERLAGELGEVIEGRTAGRSSSKDITVFKSVGFAALDVVAARAIFDAAVAAGVGSRIDL